MSSCKAQASKIFCMKPIKDDNLKLKLEDAKIPSDCKFWQTKKTNFEIFSVLPRLQRTHDCKMESIQKTFVASTTLMFKAAPSELTKPPPNYDNVNLDINLPLSLLKNSLSLKILTRLQISTRVISLSLLFHHSLSKFQNQLMTLLHICLVRS